MYWVKHIGFIVLTPFIIVTNAGLIFVIARYDKLHTITNDIISALACADLVMGIVLPIYVLAERGYFASKMICLVVMCHVVIQLITSLLMLLLVSIERWIYIIKPLHYTRWITRARARVLIALVWIYSILFGYAPLMGWNSEHRCKPPDNHTKFSDVGCTFYGQMCSSFVASIFLLHTIPVSVVMLCLHTHIVCVSIRSSRRISSLTQVPAALSDAKRDNSSTSTTARGQQQFVPIRSRAAIIIIMVVYFILSWLPTIIWYSIIYEGFTIAVITKLDPERVVVNPIFYEVAIVLGMANSAINPCIYGMGNREMKRHVAKCCRSIRRVCGMPFRVQATNDEDLYSNTTTVAVAQQYDF